MTSIARELGSTYRLQLNGLGFAGATAMVPWLHRLGVQTCYVSPIAQARSGSTHGYDVVDPTRLDPALGTAADLEELLTALDALGMGLLVDIVPNHMAASSESPFFRDVLRRGRSSPFAAWFDIAWAEQDDRILLPVLGDPLATVLEAGELSVVQRSVAEPPVLAYFDAWFPLSPETAEGAADLPVADLLARQHFRLADWQSANTDVNYRRFFDINELIGLRQEDPAVFAATHSLVLELLADPRVRGVRVDHVDGLRDPAGYLEMLRAATASLPTSPVVVVEKILEPGEQLASWPVEGTTGYEIGAALVGLFVEPSGAQQLSQAIAVATGDDRSFAQRALPAKRAALARLFPGQLARVARDLAAAMGLPGSAADVAAALAELTAQLGVYRTYRQADVPVEPDDAAVITNAAALAGEQLTGGPADLLDGVAAVLLGPLPSGSVAWTAVAGWQQLSGPATAKGVEDTAMYDAGSLLALADVGSDPDTLSLDPSQFHAAMAQRATAYPAALSSTSTHDSKRSHDVRCRLAVLSEIATRWTATVAELDAVLGASDAGSVPDAADRDYLYQTIVGAWPLDHGPDEAFVARVQACLVKSARESKRHSTWARPDEDYERAYTELARRATSGRAGELLGSVVADIECAAATNSLACVLLKATLPGVPDVYQGDDDWFLALVDPDNRRPLDLARHERLLDAPTGRLLEDWRTGPLKALVVRRALQARRSHPQLYARGGYEPLAVTGAASEHVLAFARRHADRCLVTVVPRLVQVMTPRAKFAVGPAVWTDTRVAAPSGSAVDGAELVSGRPVALDGDGWRVAELFADLPIAVVEVATGSR